MIAPGSSINGISQARILSWLPFPSPGGNLPDPGMEPTSPALAGGFFTPESPEKPRFFTVTASDWAGWWWKGLASSAQCGIPLRGNLCSGAPRWTGRGSARSAAQTDSPPYSFLLQVSLFNLPFTHLSILKEPETAHITKEKLYVTDTGRWKKEEWSCVRQLLTLILQWAVRTCKKKKKSDWTKT